MQICVVLQNEHFNSDEKEWPKYFDYLISHYLNTLNISKEHNYYRINLNFILTLT